MLSGISKKTRVPSDYCAEDACGRKSARSVHDIDPEMSHASLKEVEPAVLFLRNNALVAHREVPDSLAWCKES